MVSRGEVWWYAHESTGRRPFLILTRPQAIGVLHQILAVPATRTVRDIPTEVILGPVDGMPTRCALTLDNTTTIRRGLCTDRITALSDERMREVCAALATATGCA